MIMGLPLPRVVSDVGPGGGLVTAMGGINSLNNDMLLRKINEVKAQYAPITTQAEAASKLAYANLMGPQFLAKIMGNDSALANMSEDQKREALSKIYQAGSGQGSGINMLNQMPQGNSGVGQPSTNSLSGWIQNKFKNSFSQPIQQAPQGPGNALTSQMSQQQSSQPPQLNAMSGRRPQNGVTLEGQQWYDKNGNPVYEENQSPLELELKKGRQPTYAEKAGIYKGVVEEGQESGKIRAKDIDQLNNAVFNSETNQATLDEISDILASPTFEKIRQVPLAGRHELSFYAKEGTPEEQQMVGKYYTLTGNLIKDASRDFAGQFRKGEQQLLNGMKPGPSDTVDSAKGKTETLSVLNKMLATRSRLTSKIMSQNHVNKLDALDEADRQVNGEQIRKEVHDRLNPTVTIRNRKTGEIKTISAAEARKLGVPNV